MATPEKIGEQIWREFHERLKDRVVKAFFILPEAYTLFRKAVESFDLGAIEGAVLLCRATIESAFFLFLSIRWHGDTAFNIVFPTDERDFWRIRDAVHQKVGFSSTEMIAINRIRDHGNFVAHFASYIARARETRVKRYLDWESSNKNVTDIERVREANRILKSEKSLVTRADALEDLRDTAAIMITLGKSMGASPDS